MTASGINIGTGRHGNDHIGPGFLDMEPSMVSLPEEELEAMIETALSHPDLKYNGKWYAHIWRHGKIRGFIGPYYHHIVLRLLVDLPMPRR